MARIQSEMLEHDIIVQGLAGHGILILVLCAGNDTGSYPETDGFAGRETIHWRKFWAFLLCIWLEEPLTPRRQLPACSNCCSSSNAPEAKCKDGSMFDRSYNSCCDRQVEASTLPAARAPFLR